MLRKLHSLRGGLLLACSAWLCLAPMGPIDSTYAAAVAASDSEASQLLASELPTGVTIASANGDQMIAAVKAAVRRDPNMAGGIVRVAIVTKVPASVRRPRRHMRRSYDGKSTVDGKSVSDASAPEGQQVSASDIRLVAATVLISNDPCSYVVGVVRAALDVVPDQAAALVELASNLAPACAPDLNALLGGGGIGGGDVGFEDVNGPFGIGFGIGPGFPGAPGFIGSPPGGVVSLPPTGPLVTNVTGR